MQANRKTSLLFAVAFDGAGGKFRRPLAAEGVDIRAEALVLRVHLAERGEDFLGAGVKVLRDMLVKIGGRATAARSFSPALTA